MPAYWIARINVTDPETYQEYASRVPGAVSKYGGKFLARAGRYVTPEGTEYERNIIIEFPSFEVATECYNSPEYQRALPIRTRSSLGELVIVEGTTD